MAFKMKPPSTHKGTVRHTKELKNTYYEQLKVNRDLDKTSLPDGRAGSSPLQVDPTKKSKKEDFPGLLPEVKVKMSEHQTPRDRLARKARSSKSGQVKKGMEQSARSSDYKDAVTYLAKNGDKAAAKRLKDRAERVRKVKEKSPAKTGALAAIQGVEKGAKSLKGIKDTADSLTGKTALSDAMNAPISTTASGKEKSPTKYAALIAQAAPAIIGAMSKKKR